MIKSLPNLYSCIGLSKEAIKIIIENINNYYEKRSQPKRKFGEDQTDGEGKLRYRDLMVPKFKLKLVQQRINYVIQKIPLPDNMFGSVKGKNNILNAGQHLHNRYFLTIDLKNFFSNINERQVFQMFYANDFSYDTAKILTRLTTLNGALPQGAPSSPVIANLVSLNMVNEIAAFVKPYNITFTSYVDDLCFSSKACFKKLVSDILHIVKRNHFFPAYRKIHYRTESCEIAGLIVYANQLKLIPEMRRKAYTNIPLNIYLQRIEKYNLEMSSQKSSKVSKKRVLSKISIIT